MKNKKEQMKEDLMAEVLGVDLRVNEDSAIKAEAEKIKEMIRELKLNGSN